MRKIFERIGRSMCDAAILDLLSVPAVGLMALFIAASLCFIFGAPHFVWMGVARATVPVGILFIVWLVVAWFAGAE